MQITTVAEFDQALAAGPYAFPGGYPHYFVTTDGVAMSFETAQQEAETIRGVIQEKDGASGWQLFGMDINWEDPNLYCAHSGKRIESAYAEPEEQAA